MASHFPCLETESQDSVQYFLLPNNIKTVSNISVLWKQVYILRENV